MGEGSMHTVEQADIERTSELVHALNTHLTKILEKHPEIDIRTETGYSFGEHAWVSIEFAHGHIFVR
ncbi:MAG: hypothetical protein ACM3Q1_15570 [Bacteroidales bacterium]